MIDYALKVSHSQRLYYVGHSQGTVMGFAGFSSNQSLASQIARFYALAPVTTVGHIEGVFKYFSELLEHFKAIKVCVCTQSMFPVAYIMCMFINAVLKSRPNTSLLLFLYFPSFSLLLPIFLPLPPPLPPSPQHLLDIVGHGEFLPSKGLVSDLGELFCKTDLEEEVCGDILFLICGFDKKNMNEVL